MSDSPETSDAVSREAREAAATLIENYWLGAGEQHDRMRALAASIRDGHGGTFVQAFARFERETLARASSHAAGVEAIEAAAWAHRVARTGRPREQFSKPLAPSELRYMRVALEAALATPTASTGAEEATGLVRALQRTVANQARIISELRGMQEPDATTTVEAHADGEVRPYPELLSATEGKELLGLAEELWSDLQRNNLGGYSGINRPFYILNEFRRVIEQFGRRDVGLHWSKNDLDAALAAQPAPVSGADAGLRRAAQALADQASDTYRKRNGQIGSIEADDGEKCWIVHDDDMLELRAALQSPAPSPIGVGEVTPTGSRGSDT